MNRKIVPLELRTLALSALVEKDAGRKVEQVKELAGLLETGEVELNNQICLKLPAGIPGRPTRPELVPPRMLEHRSMVTGVGRAALIHAMTHIEFNAINLALDVIWRYPGLPADFYSDWLRVADEEALHYSLLASHLRSLGYEYGDFSAHDSLWEMAGRTGGDVLARIALVPKTMEARGLDASPKVRAKLAQSGDMEAARIMDVILRDEIGHVAVGNHWFDYLCDQRGIEPLATYKQLAMQYQAPRMRGPFNLEARRKAGFSEAELDDLQANTRL